MLFDFMGACVGGSTYDELCLLAEQLVSTANMHNVRLAAAESCTGGLLSAAITSVPGASRVFECGFVVYSDASKVALLGVSAEALVKEGACSSAVAVEMARGALDRSGVDIAVSITGEAGPIASSPANVVGSVYIACYAKRGTLLSCNYVYGGDRDNIRLAAAAQAASSLLQLLHQHVRQSGA